MENGLYLYQLDVLCKQNYLHGSVQRFNEALGILGTTDVQNKYATC